MVIFVRFATLNLKHRSHTLTCSFTGLSLRLILKNTEQQQERNLKGVACEYKILI